MLTPVPDIEMGEGGGAPVDARMMLWKLAIEVRTLPHKGRYAVMEKRGTVFTICSCRFRSFGTSGYSYGLSLPVSPLLCVACAQEWDAFLVGLMGSMVNGAGFPVLGFLIARSQVPPPIDQQPSSNASTGIRDCIDPLICQFH